MLAGGRHGVSISAQAWFICIVLNRAVSNVVNSDADWHWKWPHLVQGELNVGVKAVGNDQSPTRLLVDVLDLRGRNVRRSCFCRGFQKRHTLSGAGARACACGLRYFIQEALVGSEAMLSPKHERYT